jgi:DNA-binding NarL/FixJ family response regulator
MSRKTRILLADDHHIVRGGLRAALERSGRQWEVCGEAENGKQAIDRVLELRPGLVILDITMPVMNGLEAARQIRRLAPETRILILSMHDSVQVREEATKAGADAYAVKTAPFEEIEAAIETLAKPVA